jgi:glutathione S-transferase
MSAPYRLYGAELSPYSQKVRAYLTYKGAPFEWLLRSQKRQEEFARYAKLPLIPVLVGADESVLQDSTPIIEALEADAPALAIEDAGVAFLSALLEDYADEWLNKAMFHYRWSYGPDQESAAGRIVDGMFEDETPPNRDAIVAAVRERMVGRLKHVGSNPDTARAIEASLTRLIDLLNAHLDGRDYLLGGKLSLADLGVAAQLQQLLSDPTPGALIRERAPRVAAWVARAMAAPSGAGSFQSLDALAPTLAPLLKEELAVTYLPWMAANAEAVASDANTVDIDLDGKPFRQAPQRYAAKAYAEIRRKRALADSDALAALLEASGCAAYLVAGGDEEDDDEGEE